MHGNLNCQKSQRAEALTGNEDDALLVDEHSHLLVSCPERISTIGL